MSISKKNYQATKTRSNRPGWSVTFRHPQRTDSRGRHGLKIRRGLNTTNETEADRLVGQLNEMLGDQRWWSVDRREEALLRFEELAVSIFFDGMEAGKISSAELREARLPMPGAEEGYSRILFTGTTGAGKTTLLRHIIGSNHATDRFPSTSTSRTTTAEIEIITADAPYSGVVTFMPEHEVRAHVDECLEEACMNAIDKQPDAKIMASLLAHREQRFRLSYVLGAWDGAEPLDADDFLFDDDPSGHPNESDDEDGVTSEEMARYQKRLKGYLNQIKSIAQVTGKKIATDLGELSEQETPDNRVSWMELFVEALGEEEVFGKLALDIMEEVEERFKGVAKGLFETGPTGWPVVWSFASKDRREFLSEVRWFSSNHHRQFGRLLTPLVDGIRIRGPLYPKLQEPEVAPKLVLLDGEGVGHTAKSASSISTRITRRFSEVDLILIVDNAAQPMQSAPLELLRVIGNSGNSDKLAVSFTHFDEVKGQNFGNFEHKRTHVLDSVRNAIGSLRQSIGAPVASTLEQRMDTHAFFLGGLDRETDKIPRGFQEQLVKLLKVMQEATRVPEPIEAAPIYSTEGLEIALHDAVEGFQDPWKARLGLKYRDGIRKEHWTRIKALARRLANAWANEYDDLSPVADLVTLLQENISKWLDTPSAWTRHPKNDAERSAALSLVRQKVYKELHGLVEDRLTEAQRADWLVAFRHSGDGSSYRRADDIEGIYEEAAPMLNSAMTPQAREFLHCLYSLINSAIEEAGGQFQSITVSAKAQQLE